MAGNPTPPGGDTRFIQTTRGLLSYSQLAPLLAERVLRVETSIASGAYASQNLGGEFIPRFHLAIAGAVVPEWAGRCRDGRDWRPLMKIWEQRFEQFGETGSQ